MASDGLSLVGFLDKGAALGYFGNACIAISDPATSWTEAKKIRGSPVPNAGICASTPLPDCQHLEDVKKTWQFAVSVNGYSEWSFREIHITPLIAFQFHVNLPRSQRACQGCPESPGSDELMKRCLPTSMIPVQTNPPQLIKDQNGLVVGVSIESDNPNLCPFLPLAGKDPADQLDYLGFKFCERPSLLQVVEFNGRCFLKNGYHRVYGLSQLKADRVPCLYLKTQQWFMVGAQAQKTFSRTLLESNNPPTCGHLIGGKAYAVKLRDFVQKYEVRWHEAGYLK
jgi:hypothetical protein